MMPAKFSTERNRAATRSPSSAETNEAKQDGERRRRRAWRRVMVMTSGAAASTTRPWSSPDRGRRHRAPGENHRGAGRAREHEAQHAELAIVHRRHRRERGAEEAGHDDHAGKDELAIRAAGAGIRDGVVATRHQQQPDERPREAADQPAWLARGATQVALHDPADGAERDHAGCPPQRTRAGAREVDILEARAAAAAARVIPGVAPASSIAWSRWVVEADATAGRCSHDQRGKTALLQCRTSAADAGTLDLQQRRAERAASGSAGDPRSTTLPPDEQHDFIGTLGFREVVGGEEHGGSLLPSRGTSRKCHRARRDAPGSSPTVGSSRMRRLGACSVARAMSARRRQPPESSRARRSAKASEAHARERQCDGVPRLGPRSSPDSARGEVEILANGEEGVDGGFLEHEAQAIAGRARRARTTSWPKTVAWPRAGRQQGREQQHRGRLAGAVRAEQAHLLARRDPQGEAVERPRAAVVAAERLGRDGGARSRRLRLARELAVGEWRGRVGVGQRRLDDVVVRAQDADRVGYSPRRR